MRCSILKQGNDLNIKMRGKHSKRQKILSLGYISKDDLSCKADIQFDDHGNTTVG